MTEIIHNVLDVAIEITFAILIFILPEAFETEYFDEKEKRLKKLLKLGAFLKHIINF